MDKRYQGRWNAHLMTNYCWSIKCDSPEVETPEKAVNIKYADQLKWPAYEFDTVFYNRPSIR